MYNWHVYVSVFLITAAYDYIWRKMTANEIQVCLPYFCPNKWEWVKAGKGFFSAHSVAGAMFIAGISSTYALLFMDIFNSMSGFDPNHPSQLLLCLFASWIVGLPMRFSPDPINRSLFKHLRTHYYKPLGFLKSSFSDSLSGVIVMATYFLLSSTTMSLMSLL